ncbi:MAG: hypothetical protein J7K87_03215 [Candidatus Aenigmarchaeota archaeon]|nr:hypothetical protein [Candidatus Aenigmarchaeota archaeon]
MIKEFALIGLLISVIFISGCVSQGKTGTAESQITAPSLENQADNAIEQELDEAVNNITVSDIENSIAE